MQVIVDIPDDVVETLRGALGEDLERAVLERLALDGYTTGRLTPYEVQQMLGFETRIEAENWLGRMGASMNYTLEDLDLDGQTIRALFSG